MSRKNRQALSSGQTSPEPQLQIEAAPAPRAPVAQVSMRLSAGKHAVRAGEAEVHVEGARIAGGEGVFEFDLFAETWVEIVIFRGG